MKRQILIIIVLTCFSTLGWTQDTKTVGGTVVDAAARPLIGVTIMVPNSSTGTITDIDGIFEVSVPTSTKELNFSYVGYSTETVDIETVDEVRVVLAEDAIGLEEAVVIGYAPVRRKDLVGSVVSIDGERANAEAGAMLQSSLRQAAGVVVQQTNGAPGSGFNIRVRGATSITASNEPLYVVDGIPLVNESFSQTGVGGQESNSLADINPNDIASIEVLKDASTTAIYGSRAANGVVLITTKRGELGQTKVDFNASYGLNSPIKTIDIVDNLGYSAYIRELGKTGTVRYGSVGDLGLDSTDNSNWQDLIFDTNPIQNYNLGISGGDAKTKFFSSLNYDDNQGILNGSRFERYNGRLNLDHTISDKFLTEIQLSYNYTKNRRVQNDNNIFGAVSSAILLTPTVPAFREDGSYGSAFGLENPIAATEIYENFLTTNRVIGNGSISYLPTQWLKLTARLGIDALDIRETVFEPDGLQSSASGSLSEGSTRNMRVLNEYLAQVTHTFDNVQLVGVVGASYQNNQRMRTYFVKNNLPSSTPSADAAASPQDVLGDNTSDILQSYLANVNLNIGGNLFFSGSFRADGSSRFISDRWGYFPGVAAGYDFAEFVPGFSQFKLRASYGQTGNNNVGDFEARALYSGARGYLNSPGTGPLQIGNPNLLWETTATVDFGIDMAFMDNRISTSVGVYQKNTTDLLLNRPLPTTSGFGQVLENIGEMRNRGIELSATINAISTDDFFWKVDLQAAYLDNEVIELFDGQPFDRGFANRVAEGEPFGSFFGYETDGIFQTAREIEDGPLPVGLNIQPGDFRFVDQNGDSIINDEDRTFIGSALPDWTGGINNSFGYKGFELSAFLQFSIGNDVYNNNLSFAEGLNGVFSPTRRAYEGAWRQEGDGNKYPRIGGGIASSNNRRTSDRFVEDGSFMRLKTAQLSYTFLPDIVGNIGLRTLRVYVSGTNLITVTNYSWYDPEVNSFGTDDAAAVGTDFLTYPQARTVQFGVNVGF